MQSDVENSCGCEAIAAQPTSLTIPSGLPTTQPTDPLPPTMVPTTSPTTETCSGHGFDNTCLFNEDPDERRTTVCIQETDKKTGFPRFRNACLKNKNLEDVMLGDPVGIGIGNDNGSILYSCGCCDKCDVNEMTHLPIRSFRAKHCRRSAICTPDDTDWEVCFAWGNGVVDTIKVCITHEDGTQEESCVDPFYIPGHASDIVTCGGCTSLN